METGNRNIFQGTVPGFTWKTTPIKNL